MFIRHVFHSVNSCFWTHGGSNPIEVCGINHSELEITSKDKELKQYMKAALRGPLRICNL